MMMMMTIIIIYFSKKNILYIFVLYIQSISNELNVLKKKKREGNNPNKQTKLLMFMTINVVDECIRFNIYLNTMKTYLNAKHIQTHTHIFGWMWQEEKKILSHHKN